MVGQGSVWGLVLVSQWGPVTSGPAVDPGVGGEFDIVLLSACEEILVTHGVEGCEAEAVPPVNGEIRAGGPCGWVGWVPYYGRRIDWEKSEKYEMLDILMRLKHGYQWHCF